VGGLLSCSLQGQTWSKRFEYPILGAANTAKSVEVFDQSIIVYHQGNPAWLSPDGQHIGLLQLDQEGNLLQSTDTGDTIANYLAGRPNTMDKKNGSIVLSGTRGPMNGVNNANALVFHYNEDLELLMFKEFETELYYEAESAIFTGENHFAITGSTNNTDNGTLGVFLMKLDYQGNVEWETVVSGLSTPQITTIYGSNVINTGDGGYFVTASQRYLNDFNNCVSYNYKRNRVLYKFNSLGELEWSKEWDNCYAEGPFNILATSDGNYVLSHATVIPELSDPYYMRGRFNLIKLDLDGNEIWNKMYGEAKFRNVLRSTIELEDGSLVACGAYFLPGFNIAGAILKTTADGDSLWMRTHQWFPGDESLLNDIVEDGQGGFVACGYVGEGEEFNGQDTWVIRTDSMGCIMSGCYVGIEEALNQHQISVYPNPASDRLHFSINSEESFTGTLEIVNSIGRTCLMRKSIQIQAHIPFTETMDISQIQSGVYVVILRNEGVVWAAERIIVR